MTPGRENVAAALAALFATLNSDGTWTVSAASLIAVGFKTFNRRVQLWTKVDANDKPALFLVNYDEDHDRKSIIGPDKNTMHFELVIYDDVSDPSVIPSQRMNNLLDAIDTVLLQATNQLVGRATLGGIVHHVWVEGSAKVAPGDLDNQSVATYPLRVLVP
jgi:hypothetical protein